MVNGMTLLIDRSIDKLCQLLEAFLVLSLSLMVVMVFGNVVLRYGFNSGITVSEEASRWLFVWMTFMGAVVALNERGHLGTDFLVAKLPAIGRKLCLGIGYGLMLFICVLICKGAWEQTRIGWSATSAAMEVSMAWFFSVGIVFAVLGGIIILRDFVKLLTGKLTDANLVMTQESEETAHPSTAPGERK